MNYKELKNKFQAVAIADTAVETFVFDDLDAINKKRNKKYPVVLLKPPNLATNDFSFQSNKQQLDDYTIKFFVLTTWTKEDKKTVKLDERYQETLKVGDDFLRSFLSQGTNVYYLFDAKAVVKTNGHHQHVDQLVGTEFSFTLRVSNIENCSV